MLFELSVALGVVFFSLCIFQIMNGLSHMEVMKKLVEIEKLLKKMEVTE